jgi:hypothetical protein
MTNSVTQSELEDVLAAIRRLVAEDRTSPVERPSAADDTRARDKLVLTPALRVHDSATDESAGAESTGPDDSEAQLSADEALGAAVPEAETPEPHAVTEKATSEPVRDQAFERDVLLEATLDPSGEEAAEDPVAGMATPIQTESPDPETLKEPSAPPADGIETAEPEEEPWADAAADVEPLPLAAASLAEAGASQPPTAETAEDDVGPASALMGEEDPEEPQQDDSTASGAGVTGRTVSLEDKIAELEAMVGMHGGWEADEGDEPPFTAAHGPHLGPEEETAYSGARSEEAPQTETAVLDEDMLRDLVAEIVRQELQGELGERITRNVRKLVRREIHRALTAQLFD